MRRPTRILLKGLLGLLILPGSYMGAAWLSGHLSVPAEATGGDAITAYIMSNGVHTDIVVPVRSAVKDWTRDVPYVNTLGKDTSYRWLALGWGDKGFYLETPTWGDLTFRVAFKAAFGMGSSAIHATFHWQPKVGPECRMIHLSAAQYSRLVTYIEHSFRRNAAGRTEPVITTANYGKADAFYEGTGRYDLFHTCNTWTNDALKACGQKACLWTPFQGAIMRLYE